MKRMKRQKIKAKYQENINVTSTTKITNAKNTNTKENIFDQIEKKLLKSLITFGLIILLLIWNAIPLLFLQTFGINYNNFNTTQKYIYTTIMDILFLIFLITIYHKTIKKDFQNFFQKNWQQNLKTALSYWAIGLIIMWISNVFISIITNGKLATNEEEVRALIDSLRWYMTFQLIIYAPISEELIFRKSIKDIIQNKYLYALVSGLIFGGLHVVSTIESPLDLLYLIPYSSLGIIFALLYQKTDNIFSTITVHSIHNSLALVLYLITT